MSIMSVLLLWYRLLFIKSYDVEGIFGGAVSLPAS